MDTQRIRKLIEEQRKANKALEEAITGVKSDVMLSDIAKSKSLEELRSKFNADTSVRANSVAEQLLEYKKGYKKGLDLADPVLSNLLQVVSIMGKDTPVSILDGAVTHFKGNQEALTTISSILKGKEIMYPQIQRFIADDEILDGAILEAQKNFTNVSSLSPVGVAMAHIEEVTGAEIQPEAIQPSNIPKLF